MTMLDHAITMARNKIKIFPCKPNKKPYTIHGFLEASLDEAVIRSWWTTWPDAAIGMPTGAVNGMIVLDVDVKKGKDGEASLKALLEKHGQTLPPTRIVRTPSEGRHIYFDTSDPKIGNSQDDLGEGLDIRGNGGYVIMPPSQNGNGKCYKMEFDEGVADLPEWLKTLILKPIAPYSPPPIKDFNGAPDQAKIEDALNYISSSCNYKEWINVGMALHSWNPNEGRYIWDAWSRKSDKYEEGLVDVKWRTFKSDGGIKIGTLFEQAKKGGWKPYRTTPITSSKTPSVLKPGVPSVIGIKDVEEFYYEKHSKEYLIRNQRMSWMSLAEGQFKQELAHRGFATSKKKDENVSEATAFIINLRDTKDIDYAGPLAGYSAGFYEMNGYRVLVTESPQIIQPVAGEWPTIKKLIQGLLFDENYAQQLYLFGWIKLAYESLCAEHRRPGQALVICGPHDCGKSLLQLVITQIFGGRAAKPYSYMTAGTDFNGELFTAEHLVIEDEPAGNDLRMRRSFGAQIKQITGCDTQRCHAKHQQAITLTPFWRLSVTLNNEAENLMVLPPIDDSIEDKMILLKASSNPMPMPAGTTAERSAFWGKLMAELPCFLDYLCKWQIPDELKQDRYGISFFHHPALLREIDALSPEFRLLNIINKDVFNTELACAWTGTAEDLEVFLTTKGAFQYETRKLLSWNNACGTYLGRLAKKYPARFIKKHTEKNYIWTIEPRT